MTKRGPSSKKRKHGKLSSTTQRRRHEDHIFIRNIPTRFGFSTVTQAVASYVGAGLFPHLRVHVQVTPDANEKEHGDIFRDDGSALARIRLTPQGKGGKIHCRGYGFLTLVPPDVRTYEEAAAALNNYAKSNPLQIADQKVTLLFFYGKEGRDAEDELRAKGRPKVDQSITEAGKKLLELIKSKPGGTMHVNDWSKADRAIVNEYGKHRIVKAAVAAEAAGVHWDGQKATFSLTKTYASAPASADTSDREK